MARGKVHRETDVDSFGRPKYMPFRDIRRSAPSRNVMSMLVSAPSAPRVRSQHEPVFRYAKKAVKRIVPLALALVFIPKILAFYVCCGLADVLRNQRRTLGTIDRYFAGNGLCTWMLSPFNLVMDLIAIPFRNKGVYKISDLPEGYQREINAIIDSA